MWHKKTIGIFLLLVPANAILGQGLSTQVKDAAAALATETYLLQYKFHDQEVLRYQVEHVSTVDTRMSGTQQTSKSHSASTKAWNVEDTQGDNITFTHMIEDVQLWQETTGREPVRYNSKTDKEVPPQYQQVAKTLNKPLAKVTINRSGQVLTRESKSSTPDLGFGGLVLPLPKESIKIGHSWNIPKRVDLKDRDGRIKQVSTQVRYRLEKVSAGVATISVKTQILTPVSDARLKSQLLQKISSGEIKFDIDAGRILSKQLDWDETVIGFNGPASNMKYLARFTEKLLTEKTASQPKAATKR